MDDLDTVADQNYLKAYADAANFLNAYNKLPTLALLTIEHKEAVESLNETYQNMTEYQKKFITDDYVKGLEKYVARMEELKKSEEESQNNVEADKDKTDSSEGEESSES